jgi:ribosomal-protein-alanine N-acetyltransferase
MREAAPATVAAAFERLELDVIEAGAQPGNAASFAVMRVCGMQPVGERDVFAAARGRHERCMFHEVRSLNG